ncbi:MAG: putative DNA-binding domain-containing protein [Gammaproteobacteria bacterium]|nr:putative DNA-binding domain-containing protein [Gammaproteobacteria bacterium]
MADTPKQDFRQQQYAFAAHLRNPDKHPAPSDIEARRMKVYSDLFFNSIASLLSGTYPVLSELLGEDRWRVLVRQFFEHHQSHSPLFLEVPQEFLAFLQEEFENDGSWPGFMLELAHYEWVELALSIAPDEAMENVDPDGNMLEGVPVLSSVAWPLAYEWPVHRLSPSFQPETPEDQPTFVVVYRKPDDTVGFTVLNGLTARLLEVIGENTNDDKEMNGADILRQVAGEIGHPDPEAVVKAGEKMLDDLRSEHVLLGTRKQVGKLS